MLRRLAAGDEGGQPVDVVLVGRRVLLRARLVGLVLLWLMLLMLRERLRIARDIRLRLARAIGLVAAADGGLRVIITVVEAVVAGSARHLVLGSGQVRIVLPELFLRRRDHAVIVLGVLVVIFGGDRVAGGLRIARQLHIFFGNVGRVAANFHVRTVRFEHARHRIVTFAMVVVAPAHALVLTVSHDLPVANPFIVAAALPTPC